MFPDDGPFIIRKVGRFIQYLIGYIHFPDIMEKRNHASSVSIRLLIPRR